MYRKIALVTLLFIFVGLVGYFASRNSVTQLPLLWQSTLIPGGITGPNNTAIGNPIYLLGNETLLTFGGWDPIHAKSLDGSPRWAFVPPAPSELCMSIAVKFDQMVLIGTNKNHLNALDTSGNLLWTTKLPGSKDWYCSAAFGDDDRIYAFADIGFVYCLDLDGNIIWKSDIPELRATGAPVIGPNGIIYGYSDQLELVAISQMGTELWRSPPGTAGIDKVFVTKSGTVICPKLVSGVVNAIDNQGNLLWTYNLNTSSGLSGEPAFSPSGTTYVFEANPQAGDRLIAIDATGKLVLSYPCNSMFSQLAVLADGRIVIIESTFASGMMKNKFSMIVFSIFGSKSGGVTILDQQGTLEARAKLPTYYSMVPPVEFEDDKLLVLGSDGELYCYSTEY